MLTTLLRTRAAMPATDVAGRDTTEAGTGEPRVAEGSRRLAADGRSSRADRIPIAAPIPPASTEVTRTSASTGPTGRPTPDDRPHDSPEDGARGSGVAHVSEAADGGAQ